MNSAVAYQIFKPLQKITPNNEIQSGWGIQQTSIDDLLHQLRTGEDQASARTVECVSCYAMNAGKICLSCGHSSTCRSCLINITNVAIDQGRFTIACPVCRSQYGSWL